MFYLFLHLQSSNFLLALFFQIKLLVKQLRLRSSHRLQTKHEGLWAVEVLDLHNRLVVMIDDTTFDHDNYSVPVYFHDITVGRLLSFTVLHELQMRGPHSRSS